MIINQPWCSLNLTCWLFRMITLEIIFMPRQKPSYFCSFLLSVHRKLLLVTTAGNSTDFYPLCPSWHNPKEFASPPRNKAGIFCLLHYTRLLLFLTCSICLLDLQDLDAHQRIQQPLHPIQAGAQLLSNMLGTQRLLGPEQQVKYSQLTGWKYHLQKDCEVNSFALVGRLLVKKLWLWADPPP